MNILTLPLFSLHHALHICERNQALIHEFTWQAWFNIFKRTCILFFAQWHDILARLQKHSHTHTMLYTTTHDKFTNMFFPSSTKSCAFHLHLHIHSQTNIDSHLAHFHMWLGRCLHHNVNLNIYLRQDELNRWERTQRMRSFMCVTWDAIFNFFL